VTLPLRSPFPVMEALVADEIPVGPGWRYEPKWDGFRCLVFRDGDKVVLQSKAAKPLTRYFPDVVDAVKSLGANRFVLDGEIVVPVDGAPSFDNLLQRIHPAVSRVRTLAASHPALLLVFDLLADVRGTSLVAKPMHDRRTRLERFAAQFIDGRGRIRLSPSTASVAQARRWFRSAGGGLDGIIAKREDAEYRAGERDAMVKVKHLRTADCVVGGFRYASKGGTLGSLLLGLYDDEGLLHHVGFTSSFAAAERGALLRKVEPLVRGAGFTGQAPGGPSRWSTDRSADWKPLAPKLVVEVQYDHVSGIRFRHGTKLLRWRPDKAPRQCTLDQITGQGRDVLALVGGVRQHSAARKSSLVPKRIVKRVS
jgi:ATP-dependent DNA ligase